MKGFIFSILIGISGFVHAQSSLNMTKLGSYTDNSFSIGNPDEKYSAVWGYTDPAGNEYGIFGSQNFTYFVNVTNGNNPVLVNKFAGVAQNVPWREFKTYSHYAYGVNDGGDGSLQVFDLQYLPDSVVKVYDSNLLIKRGHTLYIDNGRLYNYGGKTNNGSRPTLTILDIATNPEQPTLLANYTNPQASYIHDGFIRNDTLYAFSGFDGLWIYNVANPLSINIIGEYLSYPAKGYCHSGWLTNDSKYLVMADEVPTQLPLKILDVSDLSNIQYIDTFRSVNPISTPHNPHIKGNLAYVSYYQDGVQVFDVSNPANANRVAFYDTYPDGAGDNYYGCWGVYPYFNSGKIIASDRKYGLIVMDGTQIPGTGFEENNVNTKVKVYPSPFNDEITIVSGSESGTIDVSLLDMQGRTMVKNQFANLLAEEKHILQVDNKLSRGIYVLRVVSKSGVSSQKLFKN